MGKVSVVMPCYNDGAYIKEAVSSVLAQTYSDVELIIVDDGSDDVDTRSILSDLAASGIRILQSPRIRPAGARNLGIKAAAGKYILPVDADDLIEPDYIEKAVRVLEENPEVGIVYCHANLFGEKNGRWELPNFTVDRMLLDNIVFVTALFYKTDWERVGGFRSNMLHGMEDYDFWLSIIELGRAVYQIPEILFHYRIKPDSRTTTFQADIYNVKEAYRSIYLNHPALYEKYKDQYAMVLREALIQQIHENKKLKKGIVILEKLIRFPILKTIIKKLIMR